MKKIIKNTLLIFSMFILLLNTVSVSAIKYIDGRFILNEKAKKIIANKCIIFRTMAEEKVEDFEKDESRIIFSLSINKGKLIKVNVTVPIIHKESQKIDRIIDIDLIPKFEMTPFAAVKLLRYDTRFEENNFSYRVTGGNGYNGIYPCFTELTEITEENYLEHAGKPESEEDSDENDYDTYLWNLKFFEIIPGEKVFVPVYDCEED